MAATTIKELLDSLPKDDQRLLDYAFENSLSQFVIVDGRYVGVNLNGIPGLNAPDLKVGDWSSGVMDNRPK